ncbi:MULTISPECIES: DUF6481 family protein [unclassified Sphingomonas]|jgi:Family of unknown function (DUF6481)|uniref:DUF6481 family protein n=1 Tax=unclassified Sphingomonas TaxID=196159 RepID=UPI000AEDC261|nr:MULTISPECIES: DUF6481 family protein [unclassified Sphingomonas]
MPAYRPPTFQERNALAARAKQAALDKLLIKAPVDEAAASERHAARIAREAAEAKKRESKRLAREQEKAERVARARERLELEQAIAPPTDADHKAAREARYSSRRRRG